MTLSAQEPRLSNGGIWQQSDATPEEHASFDAWHLGWETSQAGGTIQYVLDALTVWINARRPLLAERDALARALIQAHEALVDVFALMDEGQLVRDISHDAEDGWALRNIAFVKRLAQARAAITAIERLGEE